MERDPGRAQRIAALVAAYHAGDAVAFGWIRLQAGGPIWLLAAGGSLAGSSGGADVMLALPGGARGQALGRGALASAMSRLACWRAIGGTSDGLLLTQDAPPDREQAVPSLEECLLPAWAGPFGWLVVAQPVPPPGLEWLADEAARHERLAIGLAERFPERDVAAWDALTVEEQERVIGRAKLSNVEMDDDVKPANSHVALNTIIEPDGTQRQILRDNMPFGSLGAGEFGTYFIGYAATPSVTELMLEHMFLGHPRGNYDRILDFSTAVTGTLFFVPTADFLDDPPPLPGESGAAAPGVGEATGRDEPTPGGRDAAGDGSLGIGALRDAPA